MTRICVHCNQPYGARAGRGLCSTCWRDKAIRDLYAPLAPFGGKAASECWEKCKQDHSGPATQDESTVVAEGMG